MHLGINMASQGTQRPRRNASPSSSTKPQPMRATMPFSLSTKRTSSPPRGTYLRKPSPTSSPVHNNEGAIKATRRHSPETRNSPENRRSPTSPLLFIGSKVERPVKSGGTAIRRTSSLDTLSGSYLSSQWPRDISVGNPAAMVCKETQTTAGWDEHGCSTGEHPKHQRSASWGSADNLKEKFRQHRQRTKQNNQLYGKQSPVAGDHTAVPHLGTSSSIPIPVVPKTGLHARCSMEGLNSEIQNYVIHDDDDSVFRSAYEQTPDGHRAPFPKVGCANANTQTPGEMVDYHDSCCGMANTASQTRSPPTTPSGESKTPHTSHSEPGGRDSSSPDVPVGFKYASSPKPNNSYLFGREPPDGAEKVPLHVDEMTEECQPPCVSAPDKSKGVIKFSTQSPFHSILPSKVAPLSDSTVHIEKPCYCQEAK